ncbi:MAG TPA: nucleotide exchange factor GrpE [Verrucomicrobiae bacterium]|nr:nucleotide exchange factor GrpE [Verrucomicrobiae bacterium]
MTERKELKLPWAPFLVGDALLLGAAFLIYWQSNRPMGQWEILAFVVCTIAANVTGLIPFLLRYRAAARLAEADRLRAAVLQIQNIEIIGRQIAHATANWQNVQDASVKTVDSARQIGEVVASTARAFSDFIQRANDAEKNHLRLEVEKLRRAENDWLQILVRVLDHVFALYQAGARSGQPSVVQQLGNFQNACRDAARRVGLVPFLAISGEPFDPKLHQLADSNDSPTTESRVADTIATGFSYQGTLVRPVLVTLQKLEAHKQPDDAGLSMSMISRRHGSTHTVQDTPPSELPLLATDDELKPVAGANDVIVSPDGAARSAGEPGEQELADPEQEKSQP